MRNGNSHGKCVEEVKRAAKRVAETNDNDGVAIELERIIEQLD